MSVCPVILSSDPILYNVHIEDPETGLVNWSVGGQVGSMVLLEVALANANVTDWKLANLSLHLFRRVEAGCPHALSPIIHVRTCYVSKHGTAQSMVWTEWHKNDKYLTNKIRIIWLFLQSLSLQNIMAFSIVVIETGYTAAQNVTFHMKK